VKARVLCVMAVIALSRTASAQSRFEIGGGVTFSGGFDAGGADALLKRPGSTTPLTLFETSSRVEDTTGAAARAGVFLTSRLVVEALVAYSKPVLRTTFANDFEQATGTEATNTISSYLFGGSVRYHFATGRVSPFAIAGAARLRELDEEDIALMTGTEFHGGGGVSVSATRHIALRAEVVASSRDESFAFEKKRRMLPVISLGLSYRF
jgi:hypothetical protein